MGACRVDPFNHCKHVEHTPQQPQGVRASPPLLISPTFYSAGCRTVGCTVSLHPYNDYNMGHAARNFQPALPHFGPPPTKGLTPYLLGLEVWDSFRPTARHIYFLEGSCACVRGANNAVAGEPAALNLGAVSCLPACEKEDKRIEKVPFLMRVITSDHLRRSTHYPSHFLSTGDKLR